MTRRRRAWSLAVVVFCSITAGVGLALLLAPRPAPVTVTRTIIEQAPPVIVTHTAIRTVTAAPSTPAPAAAPPVPHINGATWSVVVDCSTQQCTSYPGAGPNGSTCGEVVDGKQVCVG